MKKITIILISICLSVLTFAQPWSVNPADYEFSMNVIGEVSISGTIQDDASNYVGAFVNDVCVGVASPIEDEGEYKLFYLTIYSNQSEGETVEFKFADASEVETIISNTIVFESDGIIGEAEEPFVWFDTEEYASTDILSFSFEEQVSSAEINTTTHTVSVLVENGTDLTNLIPEFTLAPGATSQINSIDQESGVTANDYSSDVIYVVTSADASTANWTVSVEIDNSDVEQFLSDMISVYPNPATDYLNYDFGGLHAENIQIIDMQGKVIKTQNCNTNTGRIDVSNLRSGSYFVRIDFGEKVRQIIFERM